MSETTMTASEMTTKVYKALASSEKSIDEVAANVGITRSEALSVMLYLAGKGDIELTDALHSKWAVKHGVMRA